MFILTPPVAYIGCNYISFVNYESYNYSSTSSGLAPIGFVCCYSSSYGTVATILILKIRRISTKSDGQISGATIKLVNTVLKNFIISTGNVNLCIFNFYLCSFIISTLPSDAVLVNFYLIGRQLKECFIPPGSGETVYVPKAFTMESPEELVLDAIKKVFKETDIGCSNEELRVAVSNYFNYALKDARAMVAYLLDTSDKNARDLYKKIFSFHASSDGKKIGITGFKNDGDDMNVGIRHDSLTASTLTFEAPFSGNENPPLLFPLPDDNDPALFRSVAFAAKVMDCITRRKMEKVSNELCSDVKVSAATLVAAETLTSEQSSLLTFSIFLLSLNNSSCQVARSKSSGGDFDVGTELIAHFLKFVNIFDINDGPHTTNHAESYHSSQRHYFRAPNMPLENSNCGKRNDTVFTAQLQNRNLEITLGGPHAVMTFKLTLASL
ncbi:hypothetical protein L596_020151 [Steinernema carpocapsae]|uniref:Uncharacterized protein n=1 Tax=Steinernema carpocapsae TaxID=34508 RepID=A0A4V6A0U5_STECR|nr:hypothetical protein L596_020151 [Steinernema carpocapsae]